MNESTFTPGGGQSGFPAGTSVRGQSPSGPEAVGSVAVRTFETTQHMTTAPRMMDGLHVNATAGNESGRDTAALADFDEVPQGHFYDPDAEYEPDPEYAATLAPDAARQRRERIGPTGRPLPYFPIPGPLTDHGPAKIIAMCNQKGGVGKTTSTINLGAALAEYGRRVLLVDFDPQGALSVGLGVNPMELDLTVYNLLMERGMSADEVLLKTAVPNMDLLPSNIDLSAAEVQLVSEVARESTLQRALKPLMQDYDYIVIDCQPSLGLLTVNALTAAHKVIVPLECEFFALRGVALLTETIEKVQERLNPDLELDGILATMYDSRTVHSREVLARVVEAFDDHVYHTVIGRTVRFPETTVAGEPITTYASNSVGAAAYRQLAREVLARCHAE
ncbi:ParA family protein [Streptomyces xanthochromogenes]|uniref:ParA family protein n=1 Tax=Streptomyces TaxID=1883 RepID=UPI000C28112D|nr:MULTISPECIES: ParA family protein [Streptomyces]MBX7471619.1 ParA family protein [Streptomyces sp. MAG02]MYV92811.1 AAA family ATPase [Streptomyces sp. SID1034]PJN00586.1 chromosome partitioning protein [Streptomyces sp. CB01201]